VRFVKQYNAYRNNDLAVV